jgi:hypothetical protein
MAYNNLMTEQPFVHTCLLKKSTFQKTQKTLFLNKAAITVFLSIHQKQHSRKRKVNLRSISQETIFEYFQE